MKKTRMTEHTKYICEECEEEIDGVCQNCGQDMESNIYCNNKNGLGHYCDICGN